MLHRLRLLDNGHNRALSMTAEKFRTLAEAGGLRCMSQEIVDLGSRRLIDCITVFTRADSPWTGSNRVQRNPDFMKEARLLARLAGLYGEGSSSRLPAVESAASREDPCRDL